MSNAPKRKFNLPKPVPPRSMEDIQKAYQEANTKLAQAAYLSYVYNLEVENANKALMSLNQEGAARQELDKKNAPKAEEIKEEISNEPKQS